jgi:PadR family transcriptional regulator, regulatory protein PadR
VPDKSDLPQGTLDLLILQVVAGGAIHGYGIAQRLQLIPPSTGSKTAGC